MQLEQDSTLLIMIRFIDLFAGIGGIRKGFEIAFQKCGYETECVMTSEIKPHAYKVLQANHPQEKNTWRYY